MRCTVMIIVKVGVWRRWQQLLSRRRNTQSVVDNDHGGGDDA